MTTYSVKDISKVIWHNCIVIILCALIGSVGFVGYAKHKRTTEYIAKCNIMISHNLNHSSSKSKQNNVDLNRTKSYEDIIEYPIISRHAHHLLKKYDRKKVSSADMNSSTKVTSDFNSLVLSISSKASSPVLATRMANATARATKQELPKIVPDAGKVTIISPARKADVTSRTKPSLKKYAIVGLAFGTLVGMVIAFVWTSWRHLLPEE